jgi:hypothetical protein
VRASFSPLTANIWSASLAPARAVTAPSHTPLDLLLVHKGLSTVHQPGRNCDRQAPESIEPQSIGCSVDPWGLAFTNAMSQTGLWLLKSRQEQTTARSPQLKTRHAPISALVTCERSGTNAPVTFDGPESRVIAGDSLRDLLRPIC